MADRCRIRAAVPSDAPALGVIERAAFADPWSDASLAEALVQGTGLGLVAEENEKVVGYLLAREVGGSGEILNLAVAPEARRLGVGGRLLMVGLDQLTARGATEVFLEVRESNLAARGLYERNGFRVVGVRPRYYRHPVEDALVLRTAIPASA